VGTKQVTTDFVSTKENGVKTGVPGKLCVESGKNAAYTLFRHYLFNNFARRNILAFFASSTKTRPTTQKRTNTGGTLRLKIRATYSRQGIAERTEDTILEKVNEQDTFHTVAKQFLHQVGLHPSITTVFFRLNGKAVQSTRTPAAYGLSNLLFVVLEASVLLSTFVTPPASATPKANVGPMLRLILRCAAHEGSKGDSHMFKLGAKERFGVLKERYLERLGLSSTNSTIRLCFDGETLTDQQTPGSLDMENEDLIDVRVIAL
jgi:hypothetical protein